MTTHSVTSTRYPTKESFVEAVRKDPLSVYIQDAKHLNGRSGFVANIIHGGSVDVGDTPRHSWTCHIGLGPDKQLILY